MAAIYLVRYGSVPEVARFAWTGTDRPARGDRVVVQTHRGLQIGQVLEDVSAKSSSPPEETPDFVIARRATPEDETAAEQGRVRCEAEYFEWCRRVLLWNLPLEVVDLERTLDGEKLILYVLTERGPATTTLALQAAAEGLGIIEVQPVSTTGLLAVEKGGCGSGGCGCHS